MSVKEMAQTPRCHAFAKTSGKRCNQPAIRGGTVCIVHGGASPAAKAEAQRRIATLVDPALEVLYNLMTSSKTSDGVRATIARDLLDRAGLQAITKTQDVPWDGDPGSLPDDALARMTYYLERIAWGDDEAKLRMEQRRVLSEAGAMTVDLEPVKVDVDTNAPDIKE